MHAVDDRRTCLCSSGRQRVRVHGIEIAGRCCKLRLILLRKLPYRLHLVPGSVASLVSTLRSCQFIAALFRARVPEAFGAIACPDKTLSPPERVIPPGSAQQAATVHLDNEFDETNVDSVMSELSQLPFGAVAAY